MITAYVLANTSLGEEKEALEDILKENYVRDVRQLYGDYDLLIKIIAQDLNQLETLIVNKLRKLSSIKNTNTLIVL